MAINQMFCHGLDGIQIQRQILVHRRVHGTTQTFKHEGTGVSGIFVVELRVTKISIFQTLLAFENSVFICYYSGKNDLNKTIAIYNRGYFHNNSVPLPSPSTVRVSKQTRSDLKNSHKR